MTHERAFLILSHAHAHAHAHAHDSLAPYNVQNNTNATAALQKAIDDCGNLPGGGTVRVPPGMHLQTASLFLKSNLTFRVEIGELLSTTMVLHFTLRTLFLSLSLSPFSALLALVQYAVGHCCRVLLPCMLPCVLPCKVAVNCCRVLLPCPAVRAHR